MREHRALQAVIAVYAVVWIYLAIDPHDRSDWLLENLLVFAALGVLGWTRRWFAFSDVACALFFAFMLLHAYGAHYTYSEAPFGDWLQRTFATARNPYDRLVHFAFGLLITFPLRELALRVW